MIMGNFLKGESVASRMAARTPAMGIAHPTVVPTNVEAEADEAPHRDEDETIER
jgi:hypothetical protein